MCACICVYVDGYYLLCKKKFTLFEKNIHIFLESQTIS